MLWPHSISTLSDIIQIQELKNKLDPRIRNSLNPGLTSLFQPAVASGLVVVINYRKLSSESLAIFSEKLSVH